ncbi:MAG: ABC transporter permease [Opitutae bacterium]|nr:ABC transporter permease [Opitutae bacterium]
MSEVTPTARAEAALEGDALVVQVGGEWRITEHCPGWLELLRDHRPRHIRLAARELGTWDSSLALFVHEARTWAETHSVPFQTEGLPAGLEKLTALLGTKPARPGTPHRGLLNLPAALGLATVALWRELKDIAWLVGECAFSVGRFFRGQAQFRWQDCFAEMQQCGAMALPIVSLISFLVGVIMAYQGAVQLRQFGADIYVADMVGLSVVREMGPMMAAVVLAGRTGAAFAATLGNMKANEEIDALETLGVSPVDFLVMPRLTALLLMMPLLALYSNCLGILGGLVISAGILDIPSSLYWAETKTIIDLSDLSTGVIKAASFGVLIGLSGCLRGMQADRSAAGVGTAATRAVVTGILLIIVADSLFAVAFNILGW